MKWVCRFEKDYYYFQASEHIEQANNGADAGERGEQAVAAFK